MVEGKGGRLGPELTAVGGSRTREAMIDSVRNPSRRLAWGLTEATKEFPQEYESVTAVTADGKQIKGVTLNEDSFTVQIMDASEQIHLLEKDKLRSFQKSRESAMPKYDHRHSERQGTGRHRGLPGQRGGEMRRREPRS